MEVFTALSLGLWYAVIVAKAAILGLVIRRRIPAILFWLFFLAHTSRSILLVTMRNDLKGYKALVVGTEPYMQALAAFATIEAYILITWKIPRFRIPGLIGFVAFVAIAAAVSAGSGVAFRWETITATGWTSALDRYAGIGLAVFLGLVVLVADWFKDVDRRALYHASSLCLASFAGAIAMTFFQVTSGRFEPTSSIISSGATLAAYLIWIKLVTGIGLSRRTPTKGDVDGALKKLAASV